MDSLTLLNLAAYSAQVIAIALVGCALPVLLRIDVPRVRFAYWRALVLVCLALPWLQARRAPAATVIDVSATAISVSAGETVSRTAAAASQVMPWTTLIAGVLLAGIAVRLLWMIAGLFYLRRLRGAGTSFEDDPTRALQTSIGTKADLRYVPGIQQPVTFGVRRPVVLLPDALQAHDAAIRQAVLAHELVHVRRRDWAWIVVEELVRAAFWFNPAMWWLISRVQQAREEVVDQQVVAFTGQRKTYVEALLAFADATPLAPAPAFARRRHLFRRMVLISKEAVMSSTRLVVSCAIMALVVGGAGWYAVGALPLQQAGSAVLTSGTPGPLEQAARPISPENPIPRRLVSTAPDYPTQIAATGARGTVTLKVTLDATGRVAEVRPMSVTFTSETPPISVNLTNPSAAGKARALTKMAEKDAKTATQILDALTQAAIDGVQRWSYEPPADAPISFIASFKFVPGSATTSAQLAAPAPSRGVGGGVRGGVIGGVAGGVAGDPNELNTEGALRVGGNIKQPMKIKDVKPVYPPEAQADRVQGVVILELRIEPDGTVSNARILRSIPLLNQAALDAVLQWKFVPTLMNGQAVPVIMAVTVNFTLQ